MKIVIERTQEIVTHNGTRCRIWNGVTEDGIKCQGESAGRHEGPAGMGRADGQEEAQTVARVGGDE